MDRKALESRQRTLQVRSAQLRSDLSDQTRFLKKTFGVIDEVQAGAQWLAHNPQWPLGVAVAFTLLRPQRAVKWGTRLWWFWSTFQKTMNWVSAPPERKLQS